MSSPQGEPQPQQDTPLTVIPPSPSQMPGAKPIMNAPVETMPKPSDPIVSLTETTPPEGSESPAETVELERFKAVQRIARELEKTAKANSADAEAFRTLQKAFQADGSTTPDPLAEVQQLRQELQTERVERQRAEVARVTGVPPSQIHGNDEDAMKASAAEALSWAKSLAQQAGATPLVAPAESVTGSTPTHETGVKQIESRSELKGMTSAQIMAAYNEGRLDNLLGK